MKIHLRKRVGRLSAGNEKRGKKQMASLYLTCIPRPGAKVQYEWLNLHVYENPKTNIEKDHNKETMLLAESVKAQRILDHQTTGHGFVSSVKGKVGFLDYFKKLADRKREDSNGNYGNWQSAYEHLKTYIGRREYTLDQIDENFLEGFKQYLQGNIVRRGTGKLGANSSLSYYNKVKAALREAYMNKMIKENPSTRVKGLKPGESHRQYLTLEELQTLAGTQCDNSLLKKAFLFSALTGLRWSDVKNLCWNKIRYTENGGWNLEYVQKKTKAAEILPLSDQAITILGEKQDVNTHIFKDLCYHTHMNKQLQDWINRAGINKKITFHCARHTFATLQLSMDTDIYTVSKLLGHRHLKTTEIYAKVIDKKKIEAVQKLSFL
ncbi:Site-specific recombinase XerD [Hydrobacter penzbergensis]|uniref:Site-specific recombinase XerD n=1 Tax=Hydrobacter penzbergensis TaxID=1235997 RepID=A0A8X8IA87_9BACT|nr:site-specific integrase [Hydrobacter penzbergensis]SDW41551.1 Site-specific recombinase XerD [Hydrobacter penzbergensis]